MGQLGRVAVWTVNGVLILAAAFFAATAISSVLGELADPPTAPSLARAHTEGSQPRSWRDRQVILDRNLFQASTDTPEVAPEPAEEELEATRLPVQLLGTIVADDPGRSVAAILDEKERDHVVVRVGDRVREKASVVRIEKRRVVLRNGARLEELTLDDEEAAGRLARSHNTRRPNSSAVARARERARAARLAARRSARESRRDESGSPREAVGNRVRQLAADRFSVPRSDVETAAADPTALFSQARILPRYEGDGTMLGLQLNAIQEGSLFEQIGIEEGDTVREVNGIRISGPEESAKVVRELSEADEFTVLVLGVDGSERTLTYQVEDE